MGINEIHNLNHAQSFGAGHAARQRTKEEIQGFEELIQEKAGDRLNFSKHAAKRLGERGIAIDNQLLGDLEHAVDEARKKGSRDVAVIGSQGMFILAFQEVKEYEPPVWPWKNGKQQQMAHMDFLVENLESGVAHALKCGAKDRNKR